MPKDYSSDLKAMAGEYPVLADGFATNTSLDKAFRFLEGLKFRLAEMEQITQDEYSHDICVPMPEGDHYLVIGSSCVGSISSVTVWDHRPSADELLSRRLERGWQPQCSDMKEGPMIIGHADRLQEG